MTNMSNNGVNYEDVPLKEFELSYTELNSMINQLGKDGKLQLEKDKEAVRNYFLENVNPNTMFFHDIEEKLNFLVRNDYYDKTLLDKYTPAFIKVLFKQAYSHKFRFPTYFGALKFYTQYALKTFDGKRYLERFEDRVVMNALYLADGNEELASDILEEIISGRYQPATPTFLNAGKQQRGEMVSCFPAGTKIMTDKGLVNIEELNIDDKVLSHKGVFNKIEKVITNPNNEYLVAIKHYGHKDELISTPNHPVLVYTQRDVESLIDTDGADVENGFVWLEAQDVQEGDYVVFASLDEEHEQITYDLLSNFSDKEKMVVNNGLIRKVNIDRDSRKINEFSKGFTPVNRYVKEDYNLGLVLGWYISEGYVSKKVRNGNAKINGVHFTLGTHEVAFIEEVKETIYKIFGINAIAKASKYDGSTKISVNSGIVGEFFMSLAGTGFNKKKLSYDVLTANRDFQLGLIHGTFRGDGHSTNGACLLDLVNPELINTYQIILTRLGYTTRVRNYLNNKGNLTGQLIIPGLPGNNEELIYSIGKNLDNYSGLKGTGKNLKNSDFYKIVNGKFVYQVNNVRITNEKPDTVYNLEVEDSHTYTVNSAIVHNCFLGRTEDNMESISKTINNALQLSKRGGGVAFSLTNVREAGAPIKHIENASSGIIPVMKILEDSFSYANQLGARQGAGAVYLNVHHPDILHFLDTKRENADEKIRIKTLSLGVVIPDITFKLAQKNEDMYLFSPYDVQREYGKAFSDISVSDEYYNMLDNPRIRKTKINARKLFQTIAEIQFESGYPYILFEDTANKSNPIQGRINMSNLCSEILQVNEPSTYKEDGSYDKIGKDISCNLGSLNIAQTFDSPNFEKTIEVAIRSLTSVSDLANISSVPSIEAGNKRSHAIGLGQMNLHGFLAREHIHYDSPEALDFANLYFYSVLYYALKASNKIAIERGETFDGFENSKYFTGEFFEQYIEKAETAELESTKKLLEKTSMKVPTIEDWKELAESIKTHGIYNQNLQAIPPTGSISYINNSTASIHPVTYNIEGRKEGKTGKAYYPQPYLSDETLPYYKNAYDIENSAIIDMYAVATKYVDQGSSLTLFYKPEIHTTRELNKMYIYAWRKGIKTLYYARVKPPVINGTEVETAEDYCVSCQL